MLSEKLLIYSFYRFKQIRNKNKFKVEIERLLAKKTVRGTILIANEGINASISGKEKDLCKIVSLIKRKLRIRKLNIKEQTIDFLPFNRMKVRLKKEIVSLGKGEINIKQNKELYIDADKWNKTINEKGIKILDVRNNFEIDIGKFKNSLNPKTSSFREFPNKFKELGIDKNSKIAMYCTGGIRCEKASSYLLSQGYKNIVQLNGGIINYLEYVKKNKTEMSWDGDCFVFDNRITINKDLSKGNYDQCYGCKHPLKSNEKKLKSFEKGVSCKYCYADRSVSQKNRSKTRQSQIDKDKKTKRNNNFKKLTLSDLI